MGTIKLKRGTGTPAGSIEQYEVAMDVAAKNLYTSTDGSDAVILADNTENFLGTNTTELDVTSDLDLNNNEIESDDPNEHLDYTQAPRRASRDVGAKGKMKVGGAPEESCIYHLRTAQKHMKVKPTLKGRELKMANEVRQSLGS